MYRLRELQRDDLREINIWRNNPDLIKFLGAPFRFINLDTDVHWYENYMNNRRNSIRCAIIDETQEKIIGLISLVSIDYMNQSAELHIMIGDTNNQGKGAGTFAVRAMLEHAFNNMNLHRIELLVLADNDRAKHLYEKQGFVCEGRKRKAVFKNGKFVDYLMYAILKENYKKSKSF